MVFKWPFIGHIRKEMLNINYSGLLGHKCLQVSWFILWRHLDIAGYIVVKLGQEALQVHWSDPLDPRFFNLVEFYSEDGLKMIIHWWHWGTDCTVIVLVSKGIELFKLVQLHSGDVPEMAAHMVVDMGEETKWLLLQSAGTELFMLAELCLGNGLEMAEHLGMRLEREYAQLLFIYIMILKCMSLCAT